MFVSKSSNVKMHVCIYREVIYDRFPLSIYRVPVSEKAPVSEEVRADCRLCYI